MQQSYNTQALEGYKYIYKSIEHFEHKVFKNQGQVHADKLDFYLDLFLKDGGKLITSSEYLGDRINEDRSRFDA
jgi:hypothetical protein